VSKEYVHPPGVADRVARENGFARSPGRPLPRCGRRSRVRDKGLPV